MDFPVTFFAAGEFELLRQARLERRLGRQKLAERLYGAEVARRVFAGRAA